MEEEGLIIEKEEGLVDEKEEEVVGEGEPKDDLTSKKRKRNKWESDSEGEEETTVKKKTSKHKKKEEKSNENSLLVEEVHTQPITAAPVPQITNIHSIRMNSFMHGCRHVNCYTKVKRISEGTYGVVYQAIDKESKEIVALKHVKMSNELTREGFPLPALREIGTLLELEHPNIIPVREMVTGDRLDEVYMVMDYVEHDMKVLLRSMKHPFTVSEVKCLMHQLLSAIAYMHSKYYIHRDLKTSNLLFNNKGNLFVCDYGLARKYGDPVRNYTPLVVTLVYRAPELLLGAKKYSTALDMWSIGCIFAELLTCDLLFKVDSELALLDAIFRLVGSPNETTWPGFSELPNCRNVKWNAHHRNRLREKFPNTQYSKGYLSKEGFDLLQQLLTMNPGKRISAEKALQHPWFFESPLAKPIEEMRTFPSANEETQRDDVKSPEEAWKNELYDLVDRYD